MKFAALIPISSLLLVSSCMGRSAPWYGRGCDCNLGGNQRPPQSQAIGMCDAGQNKFHNVVTAGDNVLVIDYVHVFDNAEGVKPDGSGTNWGWMGPIPWKHGPVGNLHILILAEDGHRLRHLRNLPGPARTLPRFEWKDNQCMAYLNFGIWDWDWTTDTAVVVHIYESDPGPGREHDTLLHARISRSARTAIDRTYFIPRIEFRTTTLPETVVAERIN